MPQWKPRWIVWRMGLAHQHRQNCETVCTINFTKPLHEGPLRS